MLNETEPDPILSGFQDLISSRSDKETVCLPTDVSLNFIANKMDGFSKIDSGKTQCTSTFILDGEAKQMVEVDGKRCCRRKTEGSRRSARIVEENIPTSRKIVKVIQPSNSLKGSKRGWNASKTKEIPEKKRKQTSTKSNSQMSVPLKNMLEKFKIPKKSNTKELQQENRFDVPEGIITLEKAMKDDLHAADLVLKYRQWRVVEKLYFERQQYNLFCEEAANMAAQQLNSEQQLNRRPFLCQHIALELLKEDGLFSSLINEQLYKNTMKISPRRNDESFEFW